MKMKRTQLKNLTTQNIIDAIRWGSDLFDSIAADTYHNNSINNVNPRYCVDLSRKQYYGRLSKLVKVGLVKRVNGRYLLTFFGIVIYDVQLEFRRAVDSHLKTNELELHPKEEKANRAKSSGRNPGANLRLRASQSWFGVSLLWTLVLLRLTLES